MSDLSDLTPTVKVKPWGKGQGDFVEINEADFDPKVHRAAAQKADPLDHDGDGAPGGSLKGEASTASKGAAKRKAKAKK